MKNFIEWLVENSDDMPLGSDPAIQHTNMVSDEDKNVESYMKVGKRVAEKYPEKFLDSLWRIAKDRNDDELEEMLSKIDNRQDRHIKKGFGMEDETDGLDHGGNDVVPNSADNGMGDADLE